MQKFVIIAFASTYLSSTIAQPDVSLGYQYNQGNNIDDGRFITSPGSIITSYSPTSSGNSYSASKSSVGQIGNSGFVPSTQLNEKVNLNDFSRQTINFDTGNTDDIGTATFKKGYEGNEQIDSSSVFQTQIGLQQSSLAPIFSKHFYVHTAPPDEEEQEVVRHIQIGKPKKIYHIVFINDPSSHSIKAKLVAHVAPKEEKTAIYVLSKKNNAFDINTVVNTPAPINNKPEVFFVKYKTPEEAVHAQHTIQAQYDTLGGISDITNEGQIPVSSVIGSLERSNAGTDIATSVPTGGSSLIPAKIPDTDINTQQTYLPANLNFKYKY